MSIIELAHVTKEFRLGQYQSLKNAALNGARRLLGRRPEERPRFHALSDVTFSVNPGEVVGVIGHNGAGKSTLLKLISGITQPTHGRVAVAGSITPLIEVGAGFLPDFTGRENLYLNGAILGIPKKILARKFDEIVAFAELEGFIDTPIKRYSSGMQVRLAFSLATSMDADILIVDEVLAVGDLAFQRKCFDRMEDVIKRQGRTVLLVSHNIRQVQRLCQRVILLDRGQVISDGSARDVCDQFYTLSEDKIARTVALQNSQKFESTGELELLGIEFIDETGKSTAELAHERDCEIVFRVCLHGSLRNVTFGCGFHTTDFFYLATHNSEDQLHIPYLPPGDHEVRCKIKNMPLLPGVYALRFGVTADGAGRTVFYGENIVHFHVRGNVPVTMRDGFLALEARWGVGQFHKLQREGSRRVGEVSR